LSADGTQNFKAIKNGSDNTLGEIVQELNFSGTHRRRHKIENKKKLVLLSYLR
jgi:hypothetical protein